jgi:fatty acid synthase subunit beta
MQTSVAREEGATTYGMVAMNPKRVGDRKCSTRCAKNEGANRADFTQATLGCLVRQIATQSRELLEIVNYNIEGEQYVCSGTVRLKLFG